MFAAVAAVGQPVLGIVAFPGADGFGANALGGRGGAVYHVTNLTDNAMTPATGSFRAVLAQIKADEKKTTNPVTAATVVFDVGGTIQLTDNLDVKNVSNVTIAGQTAPGPGITMVGFKFDVTSSNGAKPTDATTNIIVRYVADRRGNTISSANDDAMGVLGSTSDQNHNTHDVILDHVTASWGMDENLSVSDSASNVTVSNSFINEALESGHQFGSLVRPRFGASVSYIGNLYANNRSRNPRPGTYNNSVLDFDFRGNTVYNWGDRAGYTGGASDVNTEFVNMNYTGNYLIAGPSTPNSFNQNAAFIVDTSNGVKDPLNLQFYQANNRVDSNRNSVPDGVDTGWNAFVQYDGTATSAFGSNQSSILTTVQKNAPFAYAVPGTETTDPVTAYQQTLANAGTTPWNRNESDTRIINQVQSNGGAILLTAPTAEYNDLINQAAASRPMGFDTDQDGMPNSWETARGLNPNLATDGNGVVSASESASLAGYTWLEMYLNDLALQASWNGQTTSWDGILNWNGQVPNLQGSTAIFPNLGSSQHVGVGSDEHVGQLFFDNPFGYVINGTGDITMDVLNHTGGTGAFATVTVNSGQQVITVPMNLSSDTHFTIAANSSLMLTKTMNAAGRTISKDGLGSVQFANVRASGLNVTAGTVQIIQGINPNSMGGTSVVNSLSILSGGTVDLTNNVMIIPYTTLGTLLSDTRQGILNGRLTTSLTTDGQGHVMALAYADNAVLGRTIFGGQSVNASNLLIAYTYAGDANLDGAVNLLDLNAVATNFGSGGGKVWTQGDANYDGVVNINDFNLLAGNFGASLGATPGPLGALVPEPAAISLVCCSIAMIARRRRQF
jgi:hypothetical protein